MQGAQEPEYIFEYMRIPSTAARSSRVAQQVFRGAHNTPPGPLLLEGERYDV